MKLIKVKKVDAVSKSEVSSLASKAIKCLSLRKELISKLGQINNDLYENDRDIWRKLPSPAAKKLGGNYTTELTVSSLVKYCQELEKLL